MFIRSLAIVVLSATFSGCGDSGNKEQNTASTTVAPEVRANTDDEEKPEPEDPSDAACYRALKSVVGARAETYCKINKDDRVCQWLYIGPDGKILFDQRSNEEIDKEGSSIALSCDAAAARFPSK
jgi:hypothetical protein